MFMAGIVLLLTIQSVNVMSIEINPRRLTNEEIELLAFRWARCQPGRILNNINIDCFVEGFKMAHDVLMKEFGDFLINEGHRYQYDYADWRIEALSNAGLPLTPIHSTEFQNALEFGKRLEELGIMYKDMKLLP